MKKINEITNNVKFSNLALNLRHYRIKCGLSIKEAAKAIDVVPDKLFKWESDYEKPSVSMIEALAKIYGVKKSDILK